ncbi:MAG: AMP phosphorylase [Halobacteria archaeon]
MELDVDRVDIGTETPTVLLNRTDAEELGVNPLDRILIDYNGKQITGIVEITDTLVEEGCLGATERLGFLEGDVSISLAPKPDSVYHIREKLNDEELTKEDIDTIIEDINRNRLNDVELGAYVTAVYVNGLSMEETINLTECMTRAGKTIEWEEGVIADKHSIGGVAGNRVTPIVIPIVAAAGVKIPKTSSRAITSPAGTADTMEVFCDVDFSIPEIKEIVGETNGCMVWGGGVDISPVDDKIVRAEYPLSLDPEGQVLASVLSKKKGAGSTHVVVDIPYGEGSKIQDLTEARELAKDFKKIGGHINMNIECTITQGNRPIGRGMGPVLEAIDVLNVLEGDGPTDLKLKSLGLSEILLDMCGSDESPRKILDSGKALEKFREMIEAQNGDPEVKPSDLKHGDIEEDVTANRDGIVSHVNNKLVSEISRRAGAPNDPGAGIFMNKKTGSRVKEGDVLYTVYSEKREKIEEALRLADKTEAVRVRRREQAFVERV